MTRLQMLHRGPLKEKQLTLDVGSIYQFRELLNIDYIPASTATSHTMAHALEEYVHQKLPQDEILETAARGGHIEVHGIYPKHFEFVFQEDLAAGELRELQFYHRPTTRKYNVVRPRFFVHPARNKFIMCVAPGTDYIKHYGTLMRHLLIKAESHSDLKLIYYPIAFHTLPFWTHLYEGFVHKGDRVIIGYVEEMYTEISRALDLSPVGSASNPYLESRRFTLPSGEIINFLGVNFSFWGNLSQVIAESICRCGASEIIYAGKLGSMTHPDSLYKNIFVPTSYYTLSHKNIVNSVSNLRNRLVEMNPDLDSGVHVSVPTVLEEDYIQRDLAGTLKASSIDNEISQIAFGISNFNITNGTDISFSSFHFASDYVRKSSERDLKTEYDLSNNRSPSALTLKDQTIKKWTSYLISYLGMK
jgi:hypothetical protein